MSEGRRRRMGSSADAGVSLPPSMQAIDESGVESIAIHYGEEVYAPVQFHSFRVGGHTLVLRPKPGEGAIACAARGQAILDELTGKEFDYRLARFRERFNGSR